MIFQAINFARILFIVLAASLGNAWAALDTTASTDDHSVNVATPWWAYTNISAAQVSSFLNANGARLTEIEVYAVSSGVPTFTVRMVKNSGAYAVPGWWWYYGLTATDIVNYLTTNNARLVEIEPYDVGGGVIRFAVIMISNTGSAGRAWSWLYGVSSSQISNFLTSSDHRLIDLDSYWEGGVKKYAVVGVANTGTDAKSWQWWLNQSKTDITNRVATFGGRIVKLDRQPDGTYNFIQVSNSGNNNSTWWYNFGFSSITNLINYANQLTARPIDIVTYIDSSGIRFYDAAFINNSSTR
ncbi:MAG: hypothetical protein JSR71_04790 [Proteobacteria bacterium]|nr:hypothetical protein [Pseudomonadota bacterium]